MAYGRTCARSLRMWPEVVDICICLFSASGKRWSTIRPRGINTAFPITEKQHPSFLGIQVIVQCEAQSVSEMFRITLSLKKHCPTHWSPHFAQIENADLFFLPKSLHFYVGTCRGKPISDVCSLVNDAGWLKQGALMSWTAHPPLLECYLLPPAALLS